MDVVKSFNSELASLYETKPPISKKKMVDVTKAALKAIKYYKHVVMSVEKFIQKCKPDYKIPGLYVVDSIVRQSRHQFGNDKDVFGPRFIRNLEFTFENLMLCSEEEKPKLVRVMNLWLKNDVFPHDVIDPLLSIASKHGISTDAVKIEKKVKSDPIDPVVHSSSSNHKRSSHNHRELSSTPKAHDTPTIPSHEPTPKTDDGGQDSIGPPLGPEFIQHIQQITKNLMDKQSKDRERKGIKNLLSAVGGYSDDEESEGEVSPNEPEDTEDQNDAAALAAQDLLKNPKILEQIQLFQMQSNTKPEPEPTPPSVPLSTDQSTGVPVPLMDFSEPPPMVAPPPLGIPLPNMSQPPPGFVPFRMPNLGMPPPPIPGAFEPSGPRSAVFEKQDLFEKREKPAEPRPPGLQPPGEPLDEGLWEEPKRDVRDRDERGYRDKDERKHHSKRKHRSRSRSQSRSRDKDGERRHRKRHRSRSREKDRDERKKHHKRSRSNSGDRQKERERRKAGLPLVKAQHVSICSRTLWFGRMRPNSSEEDIRELLREIAEPEKVEIINSRACAYVIMPDRRSAFKAMDKLKDARVGNRLIKLAWAPGKALKSDDNLRDLFEADKGVTYVEWSKLPEDLTPFLDGSIIDIESLPENLKAEYQEKGKASVLAELEAKAEAEAKTAVDLSTSQAPSQIPFPPNIPPPPGMPFVMPPGPPGFPFPPPFFPQMLPPGMPPPIPPMGGIPPPAVRPLRPPIDDGDDEQSTAEPVDPPHERWPRNDRDRGGFGRGGHGFERGGRGFRGGRFERGRGRGRGRDWDRGDRRDNWNEESHRDRNEERHWDRRDEHWENKKRPLIGREEPHWEMNREPNDGPHIDRREEPPKWEGNRGEEDRGRRERRRDRSSRWETQEEPVTTEEPMDPDMAMMAAMGLPVDFGGEKDKPTWFASAEIQAEQMESSNNQEKNIESDNFVPSTEPDQAPTEPMGQFSGTPPVEPTPGQFTIDERVHLGQFSGVQPGPPMSRFSDDQPAEPMGHFGNVEPAPPMDEYSGYEPAEPLNQFGDVGSAPPMGQFSGDEPAEPMGHFGNMEPAPPLGEYSGDEPAEPMGQFGNMEPAPPMGHFSGDEPAERMGQFGNVEPAEPLGQFSGTTPLEPPPMDQFIGINQLHHAQRMDHFGGEAPSDPAPPMDQFIGISRFEHAPAMVENEESFEQSEQDEPVDLEV